MPHPEGQHIPESLSVQPKVETLLLPIEQPQQQDTLRPEQIDNTLLRRYDEPMPQALHIAIPVEQRRIDLGQVQQQHPEPRVSRLGWLSTLMGNPELVAKGVMENLDKPVLGFLFRNGRPWGKKVFREAVRHELDEILLSENQLLKKKAAKQIKTTSGNLLAHIIVHAIAPEIPIAGRLFFIGKAILDGHFEHIPTEIVLMAPDLVAIGAATLLGPFAFVPLTISAIYNFYMQGVERRHDREVNNQIIPLAAAVMSKRRNPNLQDKRRFIMADQIHTVYLKDPASFQRLPQEAQDLNPETGLTPNKRSEYQWRKNEVLSLKDSSLLYGIMGTPKPRRQSGLIDIRKEFVRQLSGFINTGNQSVITLPDLQYLLRKYDAKDLWPDVRRLRRRFRRRARVDKRQIDYFYEKYNTEKNNLFDHPYEEVMRLRQMQQVASEKYPDIAER